MKNIKVVIGANFGDEGKGLMTDYFASRINGKGIVVRFNGGAQAGHTVTTADGNRHIFGHIGSGSFAGLPTYLSSYFVTNPMLLNKELNSLNMMKVYPEIYIYGRCLVSTPYDMLINQIVEIVHGDSKHGSCGLGFNETINRSLNSKDFGLCINDLMDETLLRERLYSIKNVYVPNRLKKLNIEDIPERYLDLLKDDGIIESYIDDVKGMLSLVTVANIDMITEFDSILFEGAQGLLLDQNHKYFPHVTRSNTGIKNVVQLIKEIGLEEENIEIVYVTRAYLTRHGVGPFPTELPSKPYSKIEDLTNIPNPYQDALRFGLLDLDVLAQTISKDLENIRSLNTLKYNVKLAITCLDQLDETVDYIINSKEVKTSVDEFIYKALDIVNVKSGYGSYGVTRDTVLSIS